MSNLDNTPISGECKLNAIMQKTGGKTYSHGAGAANLSSYRGKWELSWREAGKSRAYGGLCPFSGAGEGGSS